MPVPPAIRPAIDTDYGQLCELFEELDEHHRRARPDVFRVPIGARRSREYVSGLISGPESTILVAAGAEALLLGLASVVVKTVPETIVRDERRLAEIDNLVVRRNARRCGIAHALIEAADAWARTQNVATIELGVWFFNEDAVSFYRAVGFEIVTARMVRAI